MNDRIESSFSDVGALQERYRVLAKLGHGGMAEVFLGVQLGEVSFSRLVVIKCIRSFLLARHQALKMFINEAKTVASLSHPHIVQIYDLSRMGKDFCITMEYVKGENLHYVWRYLKHFKKQIPMQVLCKMMVEACEALHHAHSARTEDGKPLELIHRDIGPTNLMLDRAGYLKVIDFGIAKSATQDGLTSPGVIKGKYSYIAPDLFMVREIDNRVDLYALGLVFYELATLCRCFEFDKDVSVVELMERLRTEQFPKPSSVDPKLPKGFDELIDKATHKDRDRRFGTGEEFAAAIREFAKGLGGLATTSQVAGWYGQVFKERIEKRRQFEKRALEKASSVLAGTTPVDDSTLQPELSGIVNLTGASQIRSTEVSVSKARRRNPYLVALVVVVLLAVGGLAVFLLIQDREKEEPVASPDVSTPANKSADVTPTKPSGEKTPPAEDSGADQPGGAPAAEVVVAHAAPGNRLDPLEPEEVQRPKKRKRRKRRPKLSRDRPRAASHKAKPVERKAEEVAKVAEPAKPLAKPQPQPQPQPQPVKRTQPPQPVADPPKPPIREEKPPPPQPKVASRPAPRLLSGDGSWNGVQVASRGCVRCHNGTKVKKLQWGAKTHRQWKRFFNRHRHDRHTKLRQLFSLAELKRVEKYILQQLQKEQKRGIAGVK